MNEKIKGVKFGDFHSWNDLFLILGSKEIEAPKTKTHYVDIPGADGNLDLTEYFGDINFENRKLTFNFSTIVCQNKFLKLFSNIQNLLNGKKMRIIIDDDPSFYYVGRLSISPWNANKNVGEMKIEADCEPYKYKLYPTIIKETINGTKEVMLQNLRQKVNPEITVDSSMTMEFNGQLFELTSGTITIPEFYLRPGKNLVNITGNGTISFKYQEGSL